MTCWLYFCRIDAAVIEILAYGSQYNTAFSVEKLVVVDQSG